MTSVKNKPCNLTPYELRQDHSFNENFLLKRWKFRKYCLYQYYYETCNSKCLQTKNSDITFQSSHLQTIFLPKNITYLLSYFISQHFYTSFS